MRRPLAAFLLVFAAGVGLRLSAALETDTLARLEASGRADYFAFGRSLGELGVLGWGGSPSAFRGPVYPAFLAAVESFDPDVRPRSPLAEAGLCSLEIPLAGWAGWELLSPWAGVAAAALTAFHPALSRPLPACRVEPVYGLLVLLAVVSLVAWVRKPTRSRAAAAGFVIAAGLLCRSVLALFPLLLPVWPALDRERGAPPPADSVPEGGRGARPPASTAPLRRSAWVLAAASYVFLLPWIGRNAHQFGRFIPFEDRAADRNFIAAASGVVENKPGPSPDGGPEIPFDALPAERWKALERIARAPAPYLASCLARLGVIIGRHAAVLFLAGLGLLRLWRDPAASAAGLLAACFLLMYVPLSLEARYLEPVLPCLMVLAGCGLVEWVSAGVSRGRVPEGGSAPASRPALAVSLAVAAGFYLLVVRGLAIETSVIVGGGAPAGSPATSRRAP